MSFTKRDSYRFAIQTGLTLLWEFRYGSPEFYDDHEFYCQQCDKPIPTDAEICDDCEEEYNSVVINNFISANKEAAQIITPKSESSI